MAKKLKTIYHQYYCEDNGEYDIFYDDKFNGIWWWHLNDACWRQEYMNGLFNLVGYEIKQLPTDKKELGRKYIKEQVGF